MKEHRYPAEYFGLPAGTEYIDLNHVAVRLDSIPGGKRIGSTFYPPKEDGTFLLGYLIRKRRPTAQEMNDIKTGGGSDADGVFCPDDWK